MRRLVLIGVIAAGLVAVPAAHAAPPCGPAGAKTVARGADARVYVSRGWVIGCHRATRRRTRLGTREKVREAWVAGRYIAVRRRGARAGRERLSVHDLRYRRVVDPGGYQAIKRFLEVRLDPLGTAAYLGVAAAGGKLVVGVADENNADVLDIGPKIRRDVLGFAGSVVAWRNGASFRFASVYIDTGDPAPGVLLRDGDLRITARESRLGLRWGQGAAFRLPDAMSACLSSSGCGGVDAIQRAGRFAAVLHRSSDHSSSLSTLSVIDLEDRASRTAHTTPDGADTRIESFAVSESGATAFALIEGERGGPKVRRVRTGDGRLLDEGPIDTASLRRRGDRVVWRLRDGTERSASLEPPPSG